jgi:Tol biopolymer transport system component
VAALWVTNGTTRKVKAVASEAANLAAAGSPATTPSTNNVNGKIVFISDRQGDGDLTVWTMNPDGATQAVAGPAHRLNVCL